MENGSEGYYHGNWDSHIYDTSALGSITDNNAYKHSIFAIREILDDLGRLFWRPSQQPMAPLDSLVCYC